MITQIETSFIVIFGFTGIIKKIKSENDDFMDRH
jgi:hypothetical protein